MGETHEKKGDLEQVSLKAQFAQQMYCAEQCVDSNEKGGEEGGINPLLPNTPFCNDG